MSKRSGYTLLGLFIVVIAACGNSDDDNNSNGVVGHSQLNEACEATSDCVSGLACLPASSGVSVCRPVTAPNVTPNNKECAAVQCNEPKDCCDTFSKNQNCSTWAANCDRDAAMYADSCLKAQGPLCVCTEKNYKCEKNLCQKIECAAPVDCCATTLWNPSVSTCSNARTLCAQDSTTYASYCATAASTDCTCNETVNKYVCDANRCSNACTDDSGCFFPNNHCVNSHCVQCKEDADCTGTANKCVNNVCVAPACRTNADCAPFSACQHNDTTGLDACVPVGCQTDRECMTYEENYLARCDTSATPLPKCVVQCDRDSQCATSSNPLRKCVIPSGSSHGQCQDPGCDTDEECKIRLELVSQLPPGTKAVCRDKVSTAP